MNAFDALTANDQKSLNELIPFITKRVEQGEDFDSALLKAPADALAFCRANQSAIMDDVWDRLRS